MSGVRIGAFVALASVLACLGCAAEPGSPEAAPSTASSEASPGAPGTRAPDPGELRHERAVALVAAATIRENVASIVMASTPGTDPAALGSFVDSTGVGGFILMGDNIPGSPEELSSLTGALSPDPEFPTLIAVDQEGGAVSRLTWDDLPGAETLKDAPAADARTAFAARAELVSAAGIDLNFGIVADVADDPASFIYTRALGTAPEQSAERVAAAVDGERGLVVSTLKHFPGHGAAAGDSHVGIPSTAESRADWSASDAVPFRAGIDAGAGALMFGHLAYTDVDALPASLSPEWHRIAREDLGFTGITTTDDLGMLLSSGLPEYADPVVNAETALAAGNDLLVLIAGYDAETVVETIDGLAAAVEAGDVPEARLEDAAVRVAELRLERGDAGTETAEPAGR